MKVKCVTKYGCVLVKKLYQRFSGYIGASPIISAIFKIYRLTDKNRQPKRKLSQNLILDSPIF
ncbi:hypothetical protein COE69_03060 [Bacillus wiedmannii]|nr:hypothetical protein COE69_03060 [Bacillus wiedmannii]